MTRRLSPAQIEEIIDLREQGHSQYHLAKRFGVTEGAIHYQCLKHGAFSPNQRPGILPGRFLVRRNGTVQRPFTPAEDARMTEMALSGATYTAISRTLGRAYTSVRVRLMTLAMHDEIRSVS
jgi:transposase-like protein